MVARWGVLGSGTVGQVLAKGLKQHGYEVRIASRDAGKLAGFSKDSGIATGAFADVATWAEGLVLAVKGGIAKDALTLAGVANLQGKVVMDVTNPIADAPPEDGVVRFFTGPNDSLLEQLRAAFPGAHFVKAFNSVGSGRMVNPAFAGGKPSMFYCGNAEAAKSDVRKVIEQFGWEPWDMGTAKAARAIEPLCQLWCISGLRDSLWTHAFKVFTA